MSKSEIPIKHEDSEEEELEEELEEEEVIKG